MVLNNLFYFIVSVVLFCLCNGILFHNTYFFSLYYRGTKINILFFFNYDESYAFNCGEHSTF